ncbi:MAG: BON domain-containing protein [Candidatus Methylacidiphilales bacterium]|nr:BON domain-containing protein [Candidatus Methylacidiphilales bacterium]
MKASTLWVVVSSAVLAGTPMTAAEPTAAEPDETNVDIDVDKNMPLPINQSTDEADVKVTAEIRKALIAEKGLETYTHNVKIITTEKQVVHILGTVSTQEEKNTIGELAKKHAGKYPVENEIQVRP